MKPRRVTAGPSPEEVRAEELSQLFGAAGWMPSQANFADRAFVVWHGSFYSVAGSPRGHGSVSKSCQTEEQILDFLASFEVREEVDAAAPVTVDTPDAAALVNAAEDGPREYPEAAEQPDPYNRMIEEMVAAMKPDPRDEELKAALARAEAAEARVAELEAERPQQLPPNPAEAKLSDYGQVHAPAAPDPVEDEITTEHLLDAMKANPVTTQDVIAKLSRDSRRKFTELLNVEKAELRNKRNAGQSTAQDDEREKDVDRLLNLFARVGEM